MSAPHPQMRDILQELEAASPPNPETLPIAEARANFVCVNEKWNAPLPPMPSRDIVVGGIGCRLLCPEGAKGLIVFVHGGGWTFGNPATHERFARLLARLAGASVLVPDYRLAPEHPAPAAIVDVLAVLDALDTVVPQNTPVAMCGDSAGATIALAAALERPARPIAMLSLLYGCFAPIFDTASHLRNGDGRYGLTTSRMRWYWTNWLGPLQDRRAAPLQADLSGLPPCHLVAAALDPLCDDSLLLAGRLAEAGVATRLDLVPGVVHGFLQMTQRLAPAMLATEKIAAELAASLQDKLIQK